MTSEWLFQPLRDAGFTDEDIHALAEHLLFASIAAEEENLSTRITYPQPEKQEAIEEMLRRFRKMQEPDNDTPPAEKD